jgi:hypothetical protein
MKVACMKRLAVLFCCSAALVCAADLPAVHTVYLLKMSKGLDQYLANHLISGHVFRIVTDPKLADAVFTEQIGESFQAKLEEISPTPEIAKPAPPPKPDKAEDDTGMGGLVGDTVNKLAQPTSSFGKAKGTVFLVDAKSRQVVWSLYRPSKDGSSKEMDRIANDIVNRLQHDLNPKKK